MGSSVAKRTTTALMRMPPIAEVVIEIRGHFNDADTLQARADKHRLQAGQKLVSLRQRIEAGEEGAVAWGDWFERQGMGRGRKDCERLMQIASAEDPEAALLEEREKTRLAVAKHREKKRDMELTVSSKPLQVEAPDDEPEDYRLEFINRAKMIMALAKRELFEGNFAKMEIGEEVVEAAQAAAHAWQQLANKLTKMADRL